jgi:hypothetical protein
LLSPKQLLWLSSGPNPTQRTRSKIEDLDR